MRDRVASTDGQIGPVDIGDMFVPRLPAASFQNRHGQGSLQDPHDLNDKRIFRDRVQQAPHHRGPRPQNVPSSPVVSVNLADGRIARHWNDSVKDGRLVNILSNASHMDNITRERQEKVKEVVLQLKTIEVLMQFCIVISCSLQCAMVELLIMMCKLMALNLTIEWTFFDILEKILYRNFTGIFRN